MNRSSFKSEALRLQLQACLDRAGMDAMVLADEDGLCIAAAGDPETCDEVAVGSAMLGKKTDAFRGVMLAAGDAWEVEMARMDVAGLELYVSAVGGHGPTRIEQVERSLGGIARILTAN